MSEPTAAHARDLGDYVALARRRWAWIVGCVVAGIAVSYIYLGVAQETYESTAKVLVESTGTTESTTVGARTNDAINLDTEAQLVKSEPVSARAAELLESSMSPVTLSNRVTVTVPPNTTVMAISFTASTAEDAQRGAAMFAQAYLENREESAQGKVSADVDRLEGQIEETTADIQDLSVAISRLDGPKEVTDRAFLVARRTTLNTQLASYNAELAPLDGTVVNPGKLILEAQLPAGPVDPNPFLIVPAGLMAGLVVGLALAAWRERSDKRIHSAAEIERLFGIVPLSTVTAVGRGRSARVIHDVRALYHTLRANGPYASEVVLLVGPDAPDTAEHLSYSLALIAARSGSDTAYLTRPNSPVLEARLRSDVEKIGALQLPNYEQLGVVIDGEIRSPNLREELRGLAATHDFLILGLPNDDPTVDLPILGRHVNMAVVVVQLGVTTRESVSDVLADLSKSGVTRVFAVTVDLRRAKHFGRSLRVSDAFADAVEDHRLRARRDQQITVVGEATERSERPRTPDGANGSRNGKAHESRTVRDEGPRAASSRRER